MTDSRTAPEVDAPPAVPSGGGRLRGAGVLLFPAAVATALSLSVLVPGALAFDIQGDFGLRAGEIGALVALFYLLSSLFTQAAMPLAGRLSPTTTVRWGLVLGGVALALPAVLGTKVSLVAMVATGGIANGLATPAANMLIALTVPPHRRGLAFGLRVSAVPASAALTACGAWVVAHSDVGWRGVAAVGAGVCLLVLAASALVARTGPLPPPSGNRQDQRTGIAALRVLSLGGLLAATACATLSPFLVEGLIAGGATPGSAALLLGVSAWIGVAARISTGLVADRIPSPSFQLHSAATMLLVCAVGMVGLGLGSGTGVLAGATLLTFGIGWAWPGLLQQATLTLHPRQLARATSYVQLGTYVGALLGPLGFGFLVELFDFRTAWLAAAATAVGAAVIIVVGLRASLRGERA